MEFKVTLTTEEIVRGLKHYRRIAKQDVLRAPETPNPEVFRRHAEARREVYAKLAEVAEREGPEAAVAYAWRQNLNGGTQDTLGKNGEMYVRAVRTFSIPTLTVVGNTIISGSVNISTIMTLAPQSTLPTGTTGSLAVSGSSLYFYNGTAWKAVTVAT